MSTLDAMIWSFSDFKCTIHEDCHGHGYCDEFGVCQCQPQWDRIEDCSGEKILS